MSTSSFCNHEYCVCNPEFSLDQACPFEFFTKIDCSNDNFTGNLTANTTRLPMICIRDEDSTNEYYTNSSCLNDNQGFGITRLALVSNQDQSTIQWSCGGGDADLVAGNNNTTYSCNEVPPCYGIVVSDSPTLAPSLMPTLDMPTSGSSSSSTSSHDMYTTGTLLVWTLAVFMGFARTY